MGVIEGVLSQVCADWGSALLICAQSEKKENYLSMNWNLLIKMNNKENEYYKLKSQELQS